MAVQQGNWRNVSDLEMLQMLKDEIIRIGIEDYPSKTKFNELYEKSTLQYSAKIVKIDNLCIKIIKDYLLAKD